MHLQIAPFTHHGLVDHETEVLRGFLDVEREHVLGILEGFSEEQLRRPMLPSGWNCLGMVKHLALSDEHYWFQCVVAVAGPDVYSMWQQSGTNDEPSPTLMGNLIKKIQGLYPH